MSGRRLHRRQLGATFYRIDGFDRPNEVAFRVLRVREPMPRDSLQPKRLQRMADHLWRGILKIAVAPTHHFGFPGFLVLDSPRLVPGTGFEMVGVPDRMYHIDVTDQLHVITPMSASGTERDLLSRTVERAFTDRLVGFRDEFWRETWTTFYPREAENERVASDRVRAFRGIRFGVVFLGGQPYLAADVRTRYLGRGSLADASPEDRRTVLRSHVDEQVRPEARALFVRDNGARKYACRYSGDTGQTVGAFAFEANGRRQTVYEYYRERFPALNVPATDQAVFVQDRRGGLLLAAPASRLFPVFTTEDEAIRRCSVHPWLAPTERLRVIERVLPRLAKTPFGGRQLTPSMTPWRGRRTVFAPPALEFGGGTIVRPFAGGVIPNASHDRFDRAVLHFGARKVQAVESGPLFCTEALPDAVLFYPEGFAREWREALISILGESVGRLSGHSLRVRRQVGYAVSRGQREGGDLLPRVPAALEEAGAGLALVILGRELNPDVHGMLKEVLRATHSQCLSEVKAREIATGQAHQLAALVRNVTLAVLTEVGVQPWVLADPLRHDLHLGIDLLHGRIGYHALYGRGGRYVISDSGTALHDGRMREQIKRPELRQRAEAILRAVAGTGEPLRSLLVYRDGRWWPSESDGLREAVDGLIAAHVLPGDFRYTVAEVRKNHLPARLFTLAPLERGEAFLNPLPGSYQLLDAARALLATTGRPGSWEGRRGRTASTVLIEVVDARGPVELEHVVEDTYRLTHLNWNAPDIEIAHPVTIRWTDHALREPLRGTRGRRRDSAEDVA
jgi:hypothetical protein